MRRPNPLSSGLRRASLKFWSGIFGRSRSSCGTGSLLQNPVLRRTMARVVTLEQACRREGADVNRLLAELNALIEAEREARVRSSEAGEAFSV